MLLAGFGENEDILAVHRDLHKTTQDRLGSEATRAGVTKGAVGRVKVTAHEKRRHAIKPEGAYPKLVLVTGDAKQGLVLDLCADPEPHVGHHQI